jgi:hypothetical protein
MGLIHSQVRVSSRRAADWGNATEGSHLTVLPFFRPATW